MSFLKHTGSPRILRGYALHTCNTFQLYAEPYVTITCAVNTVHGVLKARMLKRLPIPFSSGPHSVTERQRQRVLKPLQTALISHTSDAQSSPSQASAIHEP